MKIKGGIHIVKKFLSVLSAAAIMITASASAAFSAGALTIPRDKMDFNDDGAVTMVDMVYFSQYLSGLFKVADPTIFDFDGNGVVGNSDLRLISLSISNPESNITWEMV